MLNLLPYITNDGSIGLYSTKDNDIYHSATGASEEAYYKFVLPANIEEMLSHYNEINVLDLCYGIGYNSKCFLNFILEIYFKKIKNFLKNKNTSKNILSSYIEQIQTDNIIDYIEKLYSDNNLCIDLHDTCKKYFSFPKICISAIEIDKDLSVLSPFISNKKFLPNEFYYNSELDEKISKYIDKKKHKISTENIKKYNFLKNSHFPIINEYILSKLCNEQCISGNFDIINHIITNKQVNHFFDKNIYRIFKVLYSEAYSDTPKLSLIAFLHNIYYNHISNRHKKHLRALKTLNIDFSIKINDARVILKDDKKKYDIVFLDAFTPSKCPMLWTYDFLKLIYNHLSDDGLLITYSSAAPVRNALLECGFYIGYNFNEICNRFDGTIASKNKSMIKYELSECDLRLLKTKAGIIYRDKDLNADNEAILLERKIRADQSNLESSTHFKKSLNIMKN